MQPVRHKKGERLVLKSAMKFFISASLLAASATAASAASPYGTWLRPSTGGKISAFKCGGSLGFKVVKSDKAANVGQVIMCGAKKTGANNYEGNIKNLDDGQTYIGKIHIQGDEMSLSGCVLGGLICKTDTWMRTK